MVFRILIKLTKCAVFIATVGKYLHLSTNSVYIKNNKTDRYLLVTYGNGMRVGTSTVLLCFISSKRRIQKFNKRSFYSDIYSLH
jgi:hypothetical protein